MDDYQKLYDDEDEKGVTGFVIFFIATLMLFEPIGGIIVMFQTVKAFSSMPLIGNIYKFCGIGYLLFIFFTCICFYKLPKQAVKVAKSFLITRFIFLMLSIIINFNYTLHDQNAIGVRFNQFASVQDLVIRNLLIPVAYVSIFSICWYIFMIKSKTIRQKFGGE